MKTESIINKELLLWISNSYRPTDRLKQSGVCQRTKELIEECYECDDICSPGRDVVEDLLVHGLHQVNELVPGQWTLVELLADHHLWAIAEITCKYW